MAENADEDADLKYRATTSLLNLLAIAAAILAALPANPANSLEKSEDGFAFVAFGDMPYRTPGDFERLENLISAVNAERPAFTVHVGDVKNGILNCQSNYFLTIRRYFNQFEGPLIYTPGDNDWSDCDRFLAGGYDTRERLAELRRIFFSDARSMGIDPIPLQRQADRRTYPDMVENAIWFHRGITFATVHMVGSDNNLGDDRDEFEARDEANVAWIEAAFRQAQNEDSDGLVLFFHADIFSRFAPKRSFANAIEAIVAGAESFDRPILLVNGDAHVYGIDHPIRQSENRRPNPKVTRVIVFGGEHMHAVKITVEPDSPELFSPAPLIVKKN